MEQNDKITWPGWKTVDLIGRGSFGAVYEIERKLFDDDEEPERAALKVISIPQNDSDIEEMYNDGYDEESVTSAFHSHLKSIVAEYSLMRKMNGSSNIVNCDDVSIVPHDNGIGWDIYIKMELLTPLAKSLPAQIPEELAVRIAMDLCSALELCRKYNIIHRDIKPQNIFVSDNGDYKLGDFGIAKTVEKTSGGTKTGTYKYMAPEVYSNQPYNSTADIYSLGLVLYWLLNERRMPFLPLPPEKLKAGMEEESRRRRFSGEQIPAPKNGSEALKQITLKACAFDPKDRYQTAAQMHADLMVLGTASETQIVVEEESEETVYEDGTVLEERENEPSVKESEKADVPEKPADPVSEKKPEPAKKPDPVPEKEPEPEKEPDPVPEKDQREKKGKKWIAVLLIVVLLLGAATAAGFYFGTRVEVTKVAIDTKDFEENWSDYYSVIGVYHVDFLLDLEFLQDMGIQRPVTFEIGSAVNNRYVDVKRMGKYLTRSDKVEGGKLTVALYEDGNYLIRIPVATAEKLSGSEWSPDLPQNLGLSSDIVEVARAYRTRQKEFTTSNVDKMEGWEFLEAVKNDTPYGEWSKWTEKKINESEILQVENKVQYRSSTFETTTSKESTMEGWTLDRKQAEYSYGAWSEWSTNPQSASNTLDVEVSTVYTCVMSVYIDGKYSGSDSMTFTTKPNFGVGSVYDQSNVGGKQYKWIVSSITETTKYRSRTKTLVSVTYHYSRWGDWSKWGDKAIETSETVKVEERTVYRSRDVYGDHIYHFWRWMDWSDWSVTKPEEAENTEMEIGWMYRVLQ